VKISAITTMLSSDRLYSISQAVKYICTASLAVAGKPFGISATAAGSNE
jgi:hypothetical protein